MGEFLKIGHRGAAGHEPENTMASFQKAIEFGANAIEFDVRLTKDGQIVVFHDPTLDRTTNGKGILKDQTFAELVALDAGKGQRIPTLWQVLETFRDKTIFNIELKETSIADRVLDIINSCGAIDRVIVSAFARDENELGDTSNWQDLFWMKAKEPNLNIALLAEKPEWARHALLATRNDRLFPVYSLNFSCKIISPDLIFYAHEAGCRAMVWTVIEQRAIAAMKEWGVDGIFSDYPELL